MALIDYARQGRKLEDILVFDAHAHLHSIDGMDAVPLEEQVAEMDRIGIDVAAVSSCQALAAQFERGNDEVAEAVSRYPGRFVGYCHVSANYPELMLPELGRCFAGKGFRGIKVYQVGTPYDSPLFEPVWEFAKARGVPVLAHTWGGDLTGLDKAAQQQPDVVFIAAHAGSAFAYEPYIQAARRVPSLYLDLTYSREHSNMIEHFVEQVGVEKLVWGTDVPCFSMSAQVSKILFARISDGDKRKILYDNAARLFGLT